MKKMVLSCGTLSMVKEPSTPWKRTPFVWRASRGADAGAALACASRDARARERVVAFMVMMRKGCNRLERFGRMVECAFVLD